MALGAASFAAMAPSTSSTAAPSTGSALCTVSLPSVSVPVLSMQSTSTRARPSTAGSSCTSTRRRASRITATANASDVRSTSPSGTIATVPATAPETASRHESCERSWLKKSSAAVGTIAYVT